MPTRLPFSKIFFCQFFFVLPCNFVQNYTSNYISIRSFRPENAPRVSETHSQQTPGTLINRLRNVKEPQTDKENLKRCGVREWPIHEYSTDDSEPMKPDNGILEPKQYNIDNAKAFEIASKQTHLFLLCQVLGTTQHWI